MYGAAGARARRDDDKCELIFLYDGDLSCMRMTLEQPSSTLQSCALVGADDLQLKLPDPPLERDVVSAWKSASKEAVRYRQQHQSLVATSGGDEKNSSSWNPSSFGSFSAVGAMRKLQMQQQQRNKDREGEDKQSTVSTVNYPQLKAVCELDMWKRVDPLATSTIKQQPNSNTKSNTIRSKASTPKKLPPHMPSSKRDVLTLLQNTCPVDYLRQHHLNVPIDVALRKVNKSKLQSAWDGYAQFCSDYRPMKREEENGDDTAGHQSVPGDGDERWQLLERTFRAILSTTTTYINNTNSTSDDNDNGYSTQIITSYLHESCEGELPCWGWDSLRKKSLVQHVFIVLGAVRDMTASENDALSRACEAMKIPLVPCRLGPVPEFTSKIVSVAGFHHSRGVLGDGLVQLWEKQKRKQVDEKSVQNRMEEGTNEVSFSHCLAASKQKRTLHTIAIVPMDSQSLTADPDKRNRIHWSMVRLCVCSLWRSKLASSSGSSDSDSDTTPLNNMLTFLFQDEVSITLKQQEFIASMAEKHKAAPSERQILDEICHRRDVGVKGDAASVGFAKRLYREVISSAVSLDSNESEAFALDFTRSDATSSSVELIDLVYAQETFESDELSTPSTLGKRTWALFAIIDVHSDNHSRVKTIRDKVREAFAETGIRVVEQRSLCEDRAQDEEASTIMMLQHLDYQSKLFPLLYKMTKGSSVVDPINNERDRVMSMSEDNAGDNNDAKKKRKHRKHKWKHTERESISGKHSKKRRKQGRDV